MKYKRRAVGAHGIHSPFVFEFFNEILQKVDQVEDTDIQQLRKQLLKDQREITITDLGVGSRLKSKQSDDKRKIARLARTSAIDRKYGRMLNRMVEHYQLGTCLELGTSLGIGAAYIAKKTDELISIEGCPNIQIEAVRNTEKLNLHNIHFINAEFSQVLDNILAEIDQLDLAYIDGNHGYEPTLDYFNKLIEKAHNDTFLVFDDINWSEGMRKAWDEIIASDKVNVSIELFRMGIVLKREEQRKQHFVLKF